MEDPGQQTTNRKRRSKKVVVTIASIGSVAVILTVGSLLLLTGKDLPKVESTTVTQGELSQQEESSQVESQQEESSQGGAQQEEPSQQELPQEESLQDKYGDVDIVADTEEEIALKKKYEKLQAQYEEMEFENWEIAELLDLQTAKDGTDKDISFYYDASSEEIVYVYDQLVRDDEPTEETELVISEDVQRIIDAINGNENLSDAEKQHIIDTYTQTWVTNEGYLDVDQLVDCYSNLEINYEYIKGGKEVEHAYNPITNAAGTHSRTENLITLYVANNIEEILDSDSFTVTLNHELNHVNGDFVQYGASLLNEGCTQILAPDTNSVYDGYDLEQAMTILYCETFGRETIKEGYYGFDLATALTNVIVEATSRDSTEVYSDVTKLLEETDSVLYDMGANEENYQENKELMSRFDEIVSQLSSYSQAINGYSLEQNQIAVLMQDYLTGQHESQLYTDEEKIEDFSYDATTGEVKVKICKGYIIHNSDSASGYDFYFNYRNISLTELNKTSIKTRTETIKDRDLDYYTSR